MTRVLLVDDEPLVLIGMQGMLNWAALGYEVVGTARNGAEALRAVQAFQQGQRVFRCGGLQTACLLVQFGHLRRRAACAACNR